MCIPRHPCHYVEHREAIVVAAMGRQIVGDFVDYTYITEDVLRLSLPDSAKRRVGTDYTFPD